MSKNKGAKKALIEIYGEHCMFERAKIAERIEQIGRNTNIQKLCSRETI